MRYFFILIPILILTSCQEDSLQQEPPVRPVKFFQLEAGNSQESQTFAGLIKAGNEASLAFKVGGVVQKVVVQNGDKVKRGQLIAQVDPVDYSLQVDQAKVQVKQAETSLNVARSAYQRTDRLYESNSVSLSEYEQAKGNYEANKAQLEAAQKQVEAAQNQLAYAQLRAPFDGVISNLSIESGELVGVGTPIGTISTQGNPEAEVGVPDNVIGSLKPGQKVNILLSAIPETVFEGTIKVVSFGLSSSTTFPVRATISKPDDRIRPGMSAEVQFLPSAQTEENTAIMIPAKSVGEDAAGERFVYKLIGVGDTVTVQRQGIRVGKLSSQGFVVEDGLSSGDRIATVGISSLLDGMTVRLLR